MTRCVRFRLAADKQAVREARVRVRELGGLPAHTIAGAELVISELVANALLHAHLQPDDEIDVSLSEDDECLTIEVDDHGAFSGRPRGRRGIGLKVLDALCEDWDAASGNVRATIRIQSAAPATPRPETADAEADSAAATSAASPRRWPRLARRSAPRRATPHEGDGPTPLDPQQRLVVDALRAAGGAPVSFASLREAGVEYPAIVTSELELAGAAIERTHEGARLVTPADEPALDEQRARRPPVPVAEDPAPEPSARAGRVEPLVPDDVVHASSRPWRPHLRAVGRARAAALARAGALVGRAASRRRSIAALALVAVLGLLAGSLAVLVSGGHGPLVRVSPARHRAVATTPRRPSRRHAPVAPVSTLLAVRLETRAHALIERGRYRRAVGLLRRALSATGERVRDCVQPSSVPCLTYAYALYDLGRALWLNGQPDAAAAVLSRRLEIDNQRPVVAAALLLAQAEAHQRGRASTTRGA